MESQLKTTTVIQGEHFMKINEC